MFYLFTRKEHISTKPAFQWWCYVTHVNNAFSAQKVLWQTTLCKQQRETEPNLRRPLWQAWDKNINKFRCYDHVLQMGCSIGHSICPGDWTISQFRVASFYQTLIILGLVVDFSNQQCSCTNIDIETKCDQELQTRSVGDNNEKKTFK